MRTGGGGFTLIYFLPPQGFATEGPANPARDQQPFGAPGIWPPSPPRSSYRRLDSLGALRPPSQGLEAQEPARRSRLVPPAALQGLRLDSPAPRGSSSKALAAIVGVAVLALPFGDLPTVARVTQVAPPRYPPVGSIWSYARPSRGDIQNPLSIFLGCIAWCK